MYMKKKIFKIVKKIFHKFCYILEKDMPTKYLGTTYGGWHILDKELNDNLCVVSAGVGEDISFDVEILNNFNAKVYFIDPTPRAIHHIESVINNLGNRKTREYDEKSGIQVVESYELSDIKASDFELIDKALFNKSNMNVRFFEPKSKKFVSHSISNFQNGYRNDTKYINVSTITLEDIVIFYKTDQIDILKLDIEGAENQVIHNFLRSKIYPKQILVEFDELSTPFITPLIKSLLVIINLKINKYDLVKTDSFPNFLFVKK